jgi:hypothetical protein
MNALTNKNKKSTESLCDQDEVEKRHCKRARLAPRHLLVALSSENPETIIANVSEDIKATFIQNHYTAFVQYLAHHTLWDKRLVEMSTAIMQRDARERAQRDGDGNRLVDFYVRTGLPVSVFVRGTRRQSRQKGTICRWENFRTFCGHFLIRHQRTVGIRLVPLFAEIATPSVADSCVSWETTDDTVRTCLWHELTDTIALTSDCRRAFTQQGDALRDVANSAQQVLGRLGMLLKKDVKNSSGGHVHFVQKSTRYDNVCFKQCELFTILTRRMYELYGPICTHVGTLASVVLLYVA